MPAERVLVRNVDARDYSEVFKGNRINVPSGGTVEMPRRDAIAFLGAFSGIDSETGKIRVKRLQIIPIAKQSQADIEQPEEFVSNLNGQKFQDKQSLEEHLEAHKDETVKEEADVVNKTYNCPVCHRICKGKQGLQIHLAACKG